LFVYIVELGEKDGFDGSLPGVIEGNILKARQLFEEIRKVNTAPPAIPGSSRAIASTSQARSFANTGNNNNNSVKGRVDRVA